MTNTGGYQPSSAVDTGRQWLQRWVTASVLSVVEAQRIDMYEAQRGLAAYAPDPLLDGSMPEGLVAIVDSWAYRWTTVQLIREPQRTAILADVEAVSGAPSAPPAAPQWTPEAPVAAGATMLVGGTPAPARGPQPTGAPSAVPAGPGSTPEAPPEAASSGLAVLSEVLGYSGAVLAIGGSVYLMRNVWPTVAGAAQIMIAVIGVLLFGGLGALIKVDTIPAFKRLRAVTWLSATVAGGGVGAVLAYQAYDPLPVRNAIFLIALCSAIVSAGLWAIGRHPVQEGTLFAGLLVAIPAGVYMAAPLWVAGLALWVAASTLFVLGMARLLPMPGLCLTLGAVALPIGVALTVSPDSAAFGLVFACANAIVLLALAFLRVGPSDPGDRVALGITGFVIAAFAVPGTLLYFGQEAAVQTGIAFIVVGTIVLGCSLGGLFRDRDLVDVTATAGIFVGILMFAAESFDVAPNLGLATSIGLVVYATRARRVGLQVISWIGIAGFGVLELVWIGTKVDVGAMIAVILGAIISAIAVFLSRKAARNAKQPPSPQP